MSLLNGLRIVEMHVTDDAALVNAGTLPYGMTGEAVAGSERPMWSMVTSSTKSRSA